jgi:hypothetical protein
MYQEEIMTEREYAKQQIDALPEEAVALICEFMAFQAYKYGLTTSDSDYLYAIPGMPESIEKGAHFSSICAAQPITAIKLARIIVYFA